METVQLQGESIVATGSQTWDLGFLQKSAGGDMLYLDVLWVEFAISALTQGAGGGASVKEIHDALNTVQVKSDGAWGPESLNGSELAAIHYHARGLTFPFTDANGDALVALSTGPVVRQFQVPIFAPAWFGRDGTEFTPLNEVLSGGEVTVNFNAPNVNSTTFTFAATINAYCHREAKIKAVAPLHYAKQSLKSTNATLPVRGPAMLVQTGLWKPAASRTAAEMTNVSLNGGGIEVNLVDVNNNWNPCLWLNPEVAAMRIVRHFTDPVGGTNINYLPVFPNSIQRNISVAELPSSITFNQEVQGSTIAGYHNLTVFAEALQESEIERQWASVGAIGSAANGTIGTGNGNPNPNDRLNSYLPRVFVDPAGVQKT